MRKVVISTIAIVSVLLVATTIAVLYASGYRLTQENGKTFVEGTGVIVFTSKPDSARVYVNDELVTATDNTINRMPGEYEVRIEKDGYFPWKKKIIVKKGEVSQANAILFPSTPKLDPITTMGASNVVVDTSNTLIAYTSSNSTQRKNGIYMINMGARPILPIGGLATQLTDNTATDFSHASLIFSPNSEELIASVSAGFGNLTYLITTGGFNAVPQDITYTVKQVEEEWDQIKQTKQQQSLRSLDPKLRLFATQHFADLHFSPEDDKILYTASESATMPIFKKPPLKGVNSTPETREIKAGNIYVYDLKEDRNYLLWDLEQHKDIAVPNFIWHPSSRHLIYTIDGRINIIEFDGQNNTTVYAGPFAENFVTVWPDGSNLVILTNLNIPDAPLNLYKIGLR